MNNAEVQMININQQSQILEQEDEEGWVCFNHETVNQPINQNNQFLGISSRRQGSLTQQQQYSRNISGGPSANQSLLFNDFYSNGEVNENQNYENDPTILQDIRRAMYQAQFICLLFLTLTTCKIIFTCIILFLSDSQITPVTIWIIMMISYDIFYFSHNLSIIVMLPRTPMHAFFIYYDSSDPANQDTNLSGFILGQCWSIYQPVNGLTVMDSCERFYKMIVGIGEFLRIYYIVIFIYGNVIFYTGIQTLSQGFLSYILIGSYIITGYIYLSIPLFLCISWPCLLVIIYCVPMFNQPDRPQRPLKKKVFQYLEPKKRSQVIPLVGDNNCCTICYLEYNNDSLIVELPCNEGHYFHQECSKKWLQINGTCPICRCDVEEAFKEKKKQKK